MANSRFLGAALTIAAIVAVFPAAFVPFGRFGGPATAADDAHTTTGCSLRGQQQTQHNADGSIYGMASLIAVVGCASSLALGAASQRRSSATTRSSTDARLCGGSSSSAAARRQQAPTAARVAGVCAPLTEKFDPLNLGNTDTKMERYTEVEVKHGRVAMLACLGYFLPEAMRFPGTESFENGLGALGSLPTEGWLQLVAVIGAHEILVKPRDGGLGKYDFGLGTELLEGISKEECERKLTSERNNGRLAMVGILGLMIQDGMFGNPIKYLIAEGFWGGQYNWLVKDIYYCQTNLNFGISYC